MKNQFANRHHLLNSLKLNRAQSAIEADEVSLILNATVDQATPKSTQGGSAPAMNNLAFISQYAPTVTHTLEELLYVLISPKHTVYRIIPDVDSPLDTLFSENNRPWALFWIEDSDDAFGKMLLFQLDTDSLHLTKYFGVTVYENGQWVQVALETNENLKRQQTKTCYQLVEGDLVPSLPFSALLNRLYNQAQKTGQNPVQFLMNTVFNQPLSYHRFQESLFYLLENDNVVSRFGGVAKDTLEQLIAKTLSVMLFKGFYAQKQIQAVADLNRLRSACKHLDRLFDDLKAHPLICSTKSFQTVMRRYHKLTQDWAI